MIQHDQPLPGNSPKRAPLLSLLASRWAPLLAGSVIVVATLAAYHNCFSVPFIFDDRRAITENPTIRHLQSIGRVLSPPAGGMTVSGRPVVNLSLALNYALGGTKVWGYHAFNLAVHILASLALMGIVRRTLLQPGLRERFGASALPLGLAVALLWGLHPLQTESVTYVVQRAESLMGLFYLLTVYGCMRGTETSSWGWYVVSVVACVLGMGTKEVMVSAPLMVWLYDRTFVAGTFRGALRARWRVYLGLGSSWLLLVWLVTHTGELRSERAGFQTEVSWGSYGLTQLWAVLHYLRLSIWPHPLVFEYGTFLVCRATQLVPAALAVLLLITGTVTGLVRWPKIGFLGCWFLSILVPTTSVLVLAGQTVAEHRMYLSLAAVVTAIVLGFYAWLGRRSRGLFVILAIMLGLLTARRNEDYSNKVSIWRDTVAKCPDNLRARNNLGAALLELGRVAEAMGEYQEIVRIKPDQAEAHMYLGAALLQQARFPEAIEQLEQALRLKGGVAEVHNNLGAALFRMGRVSEAIAHYEEALRLRPQDAVAHMNLGVALYEQGQVSEAIQQWEEALKLRPDYAEAHLNLGVALGQLGQGAGAVAHLEQALRLKPGDVSVRSRFAWVLATCEGGSVRNGPRAVELAEGANRLVDGKDPGILTTLAAAYAEAGRFGEATSSARQALELAIAAHNATLASELRVQIGLYQAGTPLRETSLTNAAAVRNSLVPSRK